MQRWIVFVILVCVNVICIMRVEAKPIEKSPQQQAQDSLAIKAYEITQKRFALSDTIFTAEYVGEQPLENKQRYVLLGSNSKRVIFKNVKAIKGSVSSTVVIILITSDAPVTDPGLPAIPNFRHLKAGEHYLIFARKKDWALNIKSEYPIYYPYFIVPISEK